MIRLIQKMLPILLVLCPSYVFADRLLDQIKTLIESPQIVRGNFTQTRILIGVSKKLTSDGFFLIDKSKGIVWVTERPIYQAIKITDAGIIIGNKTNTLMTIDSRNQPSVKYINELMLAMFSGDMNSLERVFNSTGEFTTKGWVLELTQKNPSSAILKSVVITGNSAISHITFSTKEGDITDINFTNVKPITSLTKDEISLFQ